MSFSAGPIGGARLAMCAALFSFSAGPVGVVVQKWLVTAFSPFLIVALQMTGGAIVLWVVRHLAFPAVDLRRSAILKGLALGILHPGAFMIIYTTASARLDSVTSVLLLSLVPGLVAVGGRVILEETLRPVVLVGIAVSLIGLVILVSERDVTGANQPSGFALGIVGLAIASGSVLVGRAFNTGGVIPWFVLAPLQATGAGLVSCAGVAFTGAHISAAALAANASAFLYLVLGMTAASYFAYNFALSRLPTPMIGLLAATGPGVGAIAAAIIFATPVGPVALFGITVILSGAALPPFASVIAHRKVRAQASHSHPVPPKETP